MESSKNQRNWNKQPKCEVCRKEEAAFITANPKTGEWKLTCVDCEEEDFHYDVLIEDVFRTQETIEEMARHAGRKTWFNSTHWENLMGRIRESAGRNDLALS